MNYGIGRRSWYEKTFCIKLEIVRPITKPSFECLFVSFFNLQINTTSLNRIVMVLPPIKDDARTPDAFCPISLQNCTIKTIGKVFTN